ETEATTTLAQITDTSRVAGRDFGMMSAASELWKQSSRPCCSRDDIVLFGPNIVRLASFALGDRICNRGERLEAIQPMISSRPQSLLHFERKAGMHPCPTFAHRLCWRRVPLVS